MADNFYPMVFTSFGGKQVEYPKRTKYRVLILVSYYGFGLDVRKRMLVTCNNELVDVVRVEN